MVALGAALVAHSVATVASLATLPLALGGAAIGAVAFAVALAFRPAVVTVESSHGKRLLGLRIATVGFCIALSGWFVMVYLSSQLGFWVAACGVAIGFVGVATHMVTILRGNGA